MQYTINGKDYTEFGINERCAELISSREVNFCRSAHYTWPIIEKRWDELNKHCYADNRTRWQLTMEKHNCTKLIAACIFFIELNEDK
jgi:hypothetical protein